MLLLHYIISFPKHSKKKRIPQPIWSILTIWKKILFFLDHQCSKCLEMIVVLEQKTKPVAAYSVFIVCKIEVLEIINKSGIDGFHFV